jgi:hypothetical protein
MGYGGQTIVAKATGIARTTMYTELRELEQAASVGVEARKRFVLPAVAASI